MIKIHIPAFGDLKLEHLVMDYNGTLAVDGELEPGVQKDLARLSRKLTLHVITADTFGKVRSRIEGIDCVLSILPPDRQDQGKLEYVKRLNPETVVSIGNGRNDRLMLAESALGIAVVLGEGAAAQTLQAADVVCTGIASALELLLNPLRLVATLRS